MSSMNFNPFHNWFEKPPNPVPSINFVSLTDSFFPKSSQSSPNFASIGLPKFLKKSPKPETETEEPRTYKQIAEQFLWECENKPDYRHTPEVEKILNEDPVFEKRNPTPEEIEAEQNWWERFRASPVVQFMTRAEEIADDMNKMELEENDTPPYRKEDQDLWRSVPHVIVFDGRPMVRKGIKSKEESDDKRSEG